MQKLAVFGGTGIIGRSIIEYLDTQDDWQGIGVARHNQQISELTPFVELDFLEPELFNAAKDQFADITHAVYAAYLSHEDKFKENDLNVQMFQGVMQALKSAAPNLRRVVLMQGVKALYIWVPSKLQQKKPIHAICRQISTTTKKTFLRKQPINRVRRNIQHYERRSLSLEVLVGTTGRVL